MKFEQFLEHKGISYTKLNESVEKIYEAEDGFLADLMKRIKGRLAYTKAKGLIPKYAEAAMEANQYIIEFETYKKTSAIEKKIEAIENKKSAVKDRDQKAKLIDQSKKLQDVIADLGAKSELVIEQRKNQLQRIIDELDEQLGLIEDADLKSLISMKKKEAGYEASEEGLAKKALMAKEKGNEKRAQDAEDEKKKLKENADELLKKLGTAEDAAAGELEDIQVEASVEKEIQDFIKSGNDVKAVKKQFSDLWDEADKLVPVEESEEFDFDSFYKSITEEDLFEAEEKFKGPKEVLSHINAIPDTEGEGEDATDNKDAKKGLYDKLANLTKTYKERVEKNIEAKKAIKAKCDSLISEKAKVTKDMLTIAGYDPEDIKSKEEKGEDGKTKTTYTPGELIPTWAAAFDNPAEYGPLKAVAEVEEEINNKASKKEETETEETPEDETEPAEKTEKEKLQDEIDDLTQRISDVEAEENPDADELEALKSTKKEKEKELSKADESVEAPTSTPAPTKTIMKFADFLASRNN